MSFFRKLLTAFVVLLYTANCYAQKKGTAAVSDFTPLEKVVFEDDLTNDALNAFPTLWYSRGCDSSHALTGAAFVRMSHEKMAMAVKATPSAKDPVLLAPGVTGLDYLPGKFTLEYDFLIGEKNYNSTLLFDYGEPCKFIMFRVYHSGKGWAITDNLPDITAPDEANAVTLPGFDGTKWHHFAMACTNGAIDCYLDNNKVLTAAFEKRDPHAFMLQANGSDYVCYTNVRLATLNSGTVKITNFDRLLTNKKFTTHDIHFDQGMSVLKPESTDLIKQLAAWLRAKSRIKIEIDGHTDNIGDASFNMHLSQARADEVKKQLVLRGISSDRLTTKGFGDTKPIKSNGTPKGRSENRRVEFIKIN